MSNYRLELKCLHKRFAGVHAIKGVSLNILAGEVHALVGENGAGKSTLMKLITGEYKPDEGEILYNGNKIKNFSLSESHKRGISIIHQELAPLLDMSIAQNIFLGQEKTYGLFLKDNEMNQEAERILKEFNIDFSPNTLMKDLSIAQMQLIEIIKAIRKKNELIIMDEPTSSLSNEESTKLFEIISELKKKNVSVIYISHRLEEILEIADRVSVLRDGEYIGTYKASEVNNNQLVELMVGRKIENIYPKESIIPGKVVFEVKNYSLKKLFNNINFNVRAGEILGFSGLMGAGRSEIVNSIFGILPHDSGEIFIDGNKKIINSTKDAIDNKIALVTEDRKMYGLVLCRSIKENISLPNLKKLFKGLFINKKEKTIASEYIDKLSIKCPSIDMDTNKLSGGNQQKVVISKWLLSKPKVLILDEPTRGIDVGAKFDIYSLIQKLAKEGIAIIIISSDLPEIMGMSDRIIVVSGGNITAEYKREEILSGKINQSNLLNSALQGIY